MLEPEAFKTLSLSFSSYISAMNGEVLRAKR